MAIQSKNPYGFLAVDPSGQLVSVAVRAEKRVDGTFAPLPSDADLSKSLKPGWRLATPGDVKAKADAEAARQRAERGEPEPKADAKS